MFVIHVNKLWFECAIWLLWYEAPVRALLALPRGRRRLYAFHIHDLLLNGSTEK